MMGKLDELGRRWLEEHDALLYTGAALETQSDDPALAPLLARVRAALEDWLNIDAERARLHRTLIATRARVAVADAALDHCVNGFAKALIDKEGRDSELYGRCFPEPHEEVVALGLDAELPAAMLVLAVLGEDEDLGASLEAFAEPLGRAVRLGNVVLTERSEAYAAWGKQFARLEAWIEGARATRGRVNARLAELAATRGLGDRWARSFASP